MAEHVFLNEDNIYVSNTRVILSGTTYATANLTSVAKRFTPASKGCAMLLTVLAVFMVLGSLGPMFSKDFGTGFVMFLVSAGLVAAGVAWLRSLKPTYHIILASASGEQQGLSSKDHDLVDRVISAISAAITQRG
jgi:hypothetical protein